MEDLFYYFPKFTPSMKYCVLMPLVMGILYFVAAGDLDYGYYTFVRIMSLVFVGIFIFAYGFSADSFFNFPVISSIALVILFNPIEPISFNKDTWVVFDIISGIISIANTVWSIVVFNKITENKMRQ